MTRSKIGLVSYGINHESHTLKSHQSRNYVMEDT